MGEDEIHVPISGIFEANSPTEYAFRFAVFQHNRWPGRPFRFEAITAALQHATPQAVLNTICHHARLGVVAIVLGQMTGCSDLFQLVAAVAKAIEIAIFLPETNPVPMPLSGLQYNLARKGLNKKKTNLFDKIGVEDGEINSGSSNIKSLKGTERNSEIEGLEPNNPYLVQMRPSLIQPLTDLLIAKNWTKFSYVCTSPEGLYRLERLVAALHYRRDSFNPLGIDLRYIPSLEAASKELQRLDDHLKRRPVKHIVLDVDPFWDRLIGLKQPSLNGILDAGSLAYGGFGLGKSTFKQTGSAFGSTFASSHTANLDGRTGLFRQRARINTQEMLKELVMLGMNRREYRYILAGFEVDHLQLDGFLYSGVQLYGFQLLDQEVEA
ncbi:unnamed protein product [Protopolystoma xenopodis]|uniref:Uncharacterized protein n=1 Tax=Protopolystoma xenopodis TaxID=117903 RepID=A0A3S5BRJ7_9PLAT|nr:unnamed protein product [Protopolystoma xenopodis]